MIDTKQKREPRYRKPCPDLPKGQRCPLCGSKYICVQWQRKALNKTATSQVGISEEPSK